MIFKIFTQFKKIFPILVKLYVPIIILLSGVIFVSLTIGIPLGNFTRDPAAVAKYHPAIGIVSNIGILYWCATASICFFCFAVLRNLEKQREFQRFILSSGLITSLLLVDDFFLLHENYLQLNIPESVFF